MQYQLIPEHLGGGTVIFRNTLEIPQNELLPYLDSLVEEEFKSAYTIINDQNGNPLHALNRGGYICDLKGIHNAPVHMGNLSNPFFDECEKVIYKALMHYIEMFPAVLRCLWWKPSGQVIYYPTGGHLGFHADNDVNYRYGHEPTSQYATRNVLSVLLYLNDSTDDETVENSFSGGHITVPYFDIDIIPSAGSVVIMPSNYLGAHEVHTVTRGKRYSYITWFAQGGKDELRGVTPQYRDVSAAATRGQWWLSSLVSDFSAHLIEKYGSVDAAPHGVKAFANMANDH